MSKKFFFYLNQTYKCFSTFPVLFCHRDCENAHHKAEPHHMWLHKLEEKGHSLKIIFTARVFLKMHDVFGSVEQMRKIAELQHGRRYTVFDFDWRSDQMNFKNYFLCILGIPFDADETKRYVESLLGTNDLVKWFVNEWKLVDSTSKLFLGETPKDRLFVDDLLLRIFNASQTTSFMSHSDGEYNQDEEVSPGFYFHPAKALLDHSCDPNMYEYHENRKRIVWIVSQPIKSGQPLFIENQSVQNFGDGLEEGCPNKIPCEACKKGWSDEVDLDASFSDVKRAVQRKVENFTNLADKYDEGHRLFKEICDEINENYVGYGSDAKVRQLIASKIVASKTVLEMIRNQFYSV